MLGQSSSFTYRSVDNLARTEAIVLLYLLAVDMIDWYDGHNSNPKE